MKTEKYGAGEECLSASLHEIRRRCMHLSARICLLMLSQVRFRSFHLIKVWDYMEAAPLPSLPSSSISSRLSLFLGFLFSFLLFFSPFFLLGLYLFTRSFSRYSESPPLSTLPFCSLLVIHYFDSYPSYCLIAIVV